MKRPLYQRVKDHIKRANLTYSEVAKRTGFSEQRVYRLLNDKTDLTGDDLETIAEAIGVSVGELFHDPSPARKRSAA